jgi:hypothetical protein
VTPAAECCRKRRRLKRLFFIVFLKKKSVEPWATVPQFLPLGQAI